MERFLENFRAIKQSSSQQTKQYFFLVRSTKTRKSDIALVRAKVEDRLWVIESFRSQICNKITLRF